MAKKTFENFNTTKKQEIFNALLNEFSNHTLNDAQVARIVKNAKIARGSFYTYFTDLYDAYRWTLKQVLAEVHFSAKQDDLLNNSEKVLGDIEKSPYYDFLKNFFTVNNSLLEANDSKTAQAQIMPNLTAASSDQDVKAYLKQLVIHTLIRNMFIAPDKKADFAQTLKIINTWLDQKG